MTIKRTVGLVGLAAVFAASIAVAQEQDKKPKGHGGKKGQGWEVFVTAFDANKDGKVSKDELLAKQPGFDAVDKNGDKLVTSDEIEAARAGKKNPKQGGWLQRFDTDKDGKVSLDEWNQKRVKAFEAADKNHDGAVEKNEFTGALAGDSQ